VNSSINNSSLADNKEGSNNKQISTVPEVSIGDLHLAFER
jgi:hypothetical protein